MKKPQSVNEDFLFYIETSKQRIAEILFLYPEKEFSLSDLAKLAKVRKSNLGIILDELKKNELIEITKLSNIWRIKANIGNWNYTKNKIVYNLNFIYQSGLVEFLADYFKNPKAIILFGSFRKGEDISNSDIDIAIEDEESKELKIIELRELSEFEKRINRRIQLYLFNKNNLDIHVFNNIANGIVLFGFLGGKNE
jgi:predicted nucleotidyltransferase